MIRTLIAAAVIAIVVLLAKESSARSCSDQHGNCMRGCTARGDTSCAAVCGARKESCMSTGIWFRGAGRFVREFPADRR
jgi:hypothetical protein